MSSFQQRESTDQEAWQSLSSDFKASAIMDWIMSNTRRFCEMAEAQQDFPFVLKPKILASYKRVDVVKRCSRDSPVQVRVLRDVANILIGKS